MNKNLSITEIKPGQKVKNFFGETLTVSEVIGDTMIRTLEDYNNLYHFTKLTVNSQIIKP